MSLKNRISSLEAKLFIKRFGFKAWDQAYKAHLKISVENLTQIIDLLPDGWEIIQDYIICPGNRVKFGILRATSEPVTWWIRSNEESDLSLEEASINGSSRMPTEDEVRRFKVFNKRHFICPSEERFCNEKSVEYVKRFLANGNSLEDIPIRKEPMARTVYGTFLSNLLREIKTPILTR